MKDTKKGLRRRMIGLMFMGLSFVGVRAVMAVGVGVQPALVPDPDTLRAIPPAQYHNEVAKDFDARLISIFRMLRVARVKGTLSPGLCNEDLKVADRVVEGERRLRASQGGNLSANQLDALNSQLEQVEEQIQESFVE